MDISKMNGFVSGLKSTTKLLFILFLSYQYSNAINAVFWGDTIPSECSLSQYTGKETKCVKLVYQEINERLDRVYSQLLKTLPKDNLTKLTKEYKSWANNKNKSCSKHSNNEIKLKACYIDKTIPKINELWKLDEEVNKGQFEGKWVGCFKTYRSGDYKVCVVYFLIQQGDNICGTRQEVSGVKWYSSRALFRSEDGKIADSIRMCNDGNNEYIDCVKDRYTDNPEDRDISEWDSGNYLAVLTDQTIRKDNFYIALRTPLLPDVKEDLIKNNKWLRDCLNYKGE